MNSCIEIQSMIGHVKDCHLPSNDKCPHNADAKFDCACKSGKTVTRKPFKTVRATCPDADRASHRNMVAMIRTDNGMLTLRLKGKRKSVSTTLDSLYERLVWNEAMRSAREAKAKRRANRRRK